MCRFFALVAVAVFAGLSEPFHAPAVAGSLQHVPQYYAQGREPWVSPFAHRHPPTSAATVSFYIMMVGYSYSGSNTWIIIATPQTRGGGFINLNYTIRNLDITDMAVNAKSLEVVNQQDQVFWTFPLGNSQILVTGSSGGNGWIATDSQGNVYVSGVNNGVAVYPYGSSSPSYYITNGITSPGMVAIDGHDNLYVCNGNNNILVFPPGGTAPNRTISQGISYPGFLAFDDANRLIVYNQGSNAITIYKEKHQAPMSTITDGLAGPSSVAVSPKGTLYVANFTGSTITEYDHERPTLSRTLATDTFSPRAIAVDAQDNLYEFDLGGKHGRTFLIYTFPHGSSQPSGPPWVVLQPQGNIIEQLIAVTGPAW